VQNTTQIWEVAGEILGRGREEAPRPIDRFELEHFPEIAFGCELGLGSNRSFRKEVLTARRMPWLQAR
jgi:hypothetical protein